MNAAAIAQKVAREGPRDAPMLIPFWGGMYIPDDPCAEGNPLFAVYDSDIVLIAETLYALAKRGRSAWAPGEELGPWRYVPLWTDYVVRPETWQ